MAKALEREPIIISESADIAHKLLLEQFVGFARTAPELVRRSLAIYDENPEGVESVVTFLEADPEAFAVLSVTKTILSTGADADLDFSDEIVDAVKSDPAFKELEQDKNATPQDDSPRSARRRMRRFWLQKAAEAA